MTRARIRWGDPHVLLQIVLAALVVVITTGAIADPDLWGHVQFGHDVVQSGTIQRSDVYSFVSDKPWINHEWLSEVAMYAAFALGGGTGLIVLKAVVMLSIFGVVIGSLGRFRAGPVAYDVALTVALVGTIWRLQTVRPQMFSLLLFAGLLLLLSQAER